jgi:hypothetical protein
MVIESTQMIGVRIASNLLLLLMAALAFYYALLSMPMRKRRWRSMKISTLSNGNKRSQSAAKLLWIRLDRPSMEMRKQLLVGSGIRLDIIIYETMRRMLIILLTVLTLTGYLAFHEPVLTLFINPIYVIASSLVCLIFIVFDRKVLLQLKERRSHRIVTEIYLINHQLLYYSGSKMNLHAKLSRCLLQTRTLRPSFQLLLNEWYQDAEAAIYRFKKRLGSDEAYSFGETLNALRLGEHEDYYDLIRQRIKDYKEKIELSREGKKEAVSYVLFVLAGLPILNTFRVFMYPWIVEGQQLFNSING